VRPTRTVVERRHHCPLPRSPLHPPQPASAASANDAQPLRPAVARPAMTVWRLHTLPHLLISHCLWFASTPRPGFKAISSRVDG
jgi:hypothetical protein